MRYTRNMAENVALVLLARRVWNHAECTNEAGEVAVAILLFSHTSSAEMPGIPSSQTGVDIGKRTTYRIALLSTEAQETFIVPPS